MGKLEQNGNPIKEESTTTTGRVDSRLNHRFRLVHFSNSLYSPIKALKNSKCTFEVHKAGLILSGDFSEKCRHISVLAQEVKSIELTRGKETIDTFYLSPIHILSKIGVSNAVTRHFRFHPTEYKISQTKIKIEAKEQQLEIITSGYRFEKLLRTFKKMGYGELLQIKRKPSVDLSDFKDFIGNT